ncbi:GNAT family N-acetyltransferase [Betaproteobacteria bacterium LSUCC0115]|nr:GNAT family N-acetyltransferase [Burkholderiales bacterium LSUCC0115]
MKFLLNPQDRDPEFVSLFKLTFTQSEGAAEGDLIGGLVTALLADTPKDDIHTVAAEMDGTLVAACILTELLFKNDNRCVFLLAPVAVIPEHQGKGIGQQLISYGLDVMRKGDVDVVMTYGDPSFYSKVGFEWVAEADAPPPYALQFPQGWLRLCLSGQPWSALKGPSTCVGAFSNPALW